jgi:multidrug efflux pump subunit AcrB
MVAVAKDIDAYLTTIDGTKNVSYSAESTPGLFSFQFDTAVLQVLGLTPGQVTQALYASLYGVDAGSLVGVIDDHDIRVVYDEYQEAVTPQQVGDVIIQTPRGAVAVRDILSYDLVESVASYQREDGRLVVRVESDVDQGIPSSTIQSQLITYMQDYELPDGVTYIAGGETSENADLISAMGTGAVIAIFLIYGILVLQFNSMKQPLLII